MTAAERATVLLAAGRLTAAQQARCVAYGWLTFAQVSPAAQAAVTNAVTLRTQAKDALAVNRTYLAVAAPTAAQTAAQVKALTRQVQGLIRLVIDQIDGTD